MFRLVTEPINTEALRDALLRPEDGAVAVFEGIVRNHSHGRAVRYLEYEAYESMAIEALKEIGVRAKAEFAIHEIGIVHRLGRLFPTECSVSIVVTAVHRAAAFDACRFAIESIKQSVPIWKKEIFAD